MQRNLFDPPPPTSGWEQIAAPGAEIKIARSFLDLSTAKAFFNELATVIPWRQDSIRVFGKEHNVPRLQQWFGEPDAVYIWSGITMIPLPWIPPLWHLKTRIEEATGSSYNSLLANFYRDGNDTVGWHSDDEPEFGAQPTIASLSLGAQRDFILRHKHHSEVPQLKIALTSGSLLVMSGGTQVNWQHSVPRRAGVREPRINLTLRTTGAGRKGAQ